MMSNRVRKNAIKIGLKQMNVKSLKRLLSVLIRSPKRVLLSCAIYEDREG